MDTKVSAGPGNLASDQAMAAMRRRVVIASTFGNGFEWYDFAIFGMFSPVIAKLFFPAGNELNSMLLTFATFAVAFAMRPLSGAAADAMRALRARSAGPGAPAHHYALADFGLTGEQVDERFASL